MRRSLVFTLLLLIILRTTTTTTTTNVAATTFWKSCVKRLPSFLHETSPLV